MGPKVIQEAKADSVVQSSTSLFFDWVLPVVLFLVFSFPFFFSAWELVVALACFTAGVTTTELCSLLLPSIKARRAFGPVLVAFTVSEKRPTKVCETRELRYCYMTKLCLCVYVRLSPLLPTLEFRNLFSKQGEKKFLVSIIGSWNTGRTWIEVEWATTMLHHGFYSSATSFRIRPLF